MDAAVHVGLTVMRMWSHGVTPEFATQTAPGVYNEAMLRGLDYAMDEAHKRNIKVGWAAVCLDTHESATLHYRCHVRLSWQASGRTLLAHVHM